MWYTITKKMTDVHILIKHASSDFNKDLLSYLHNNIEQLKKQYNIKVVVVYNNMIPKIRTHIKRLPAMVVDGMLHTGNDAIKKRLSVNTVSSAGGMQDSIYPPNTVDSFWEDEMYNSSDDKSDDETSIMADVMDKVAVRTMEHSKAQKRRTGRNQQLTRKSGRGKSKRHVDPPHNSSQSDVQIGDVQVPDLPSMEGMDDMERAYWEQNGVGDAV